MPLYQIKPSSLYTLPPSSSSGNNEHESGVRMSSPVPAANNVESGDVRPLRFLVWESVSSSSIARATPGNSVTQVFISIEELHQRLLHFNQRKVIQIFDGNSDGAMKSKKPVWKLPANGIMELHSVMGASWPALLESAKATSISYMVTMISFTFEQSTSQLLVKRMRGANKDQVKFYKEADDKNPTCRGLHGIQPAVSFSALTARAAQNRAAILFSYSSDVVGCKDLGDNDPKQRIVLEEVVVLPWVVADEGPIPHYLCRCKSLNFRSVESADTKTNADVTH
ncbi:hypothetical protein MRB53_006452 [Persea americana]|uniref:Uncharacterized protein n=1 Tax=Persea americana TaxID=3435 RepID=A0ACC2MGE2_PERAE|nr:hypothetical protein MRB53_006452 [Persea americana]